MLIPQCGPLPQVVEDGYEFFGDRELVTVFSAPHYCGEFDNCGAMMSVDENMICSFQVIALSDCPRIREQVLRASPFFVRS